MEINDQLEYHDQLFQIQSKQKFRYSYIYELHLPKSETKYLLFQPRTSREEYFNLQFNFQQINSNKKPQTNHIN